MTFKFAAPPFGAQRIICIALVAGQVMYAIVVGICVLTDIDLQPQEQDSLELLDSLLTYAAVPMAIIGVVLRSLLTNYANRLAGSKRLDVRSMSRILPLALIEGACLLAITIYLLNQSILALPIIGVLLAIGISWIPFRDIDATEAG